MTRAPYSPISPALADAADVFLAGTAAVRAAVASEAVAAAWEQPSVLEQQTVGGVAGHLARTGGWLVGDYLAEGPPDGPPGFDDAADCYARLMESLGPDDHAAIRDRGAQLAARGQAWIVAQLDEKLPGLAATLADLDDDATVAAYAGVPLRVRDYLVTRIVEQVVHLDDLARSVGADGWAVPPAAVDLTMAVAVEVARRRRGDTAVLRALYRTGGADGVFPAL